MAKLLLLFIIVLMVIALFTRAVVIRRVLWTIVALSVLYSILKLTGAIEAMAPDRMGYLDTLIASI